MGRTRQPHGEPSRAQPSVTDPEVIDLIEGVRSIRRTIDTDLTAAAGALDADRVDVAQDIVDGALADVAAFRAVAIERLRSQPARAESARPRNRRARALIAIPAIPLVGALAMGAAAAIGGLNTPLHHSKPSAVTHVIAAPATPHSLPTSATTTLARLERVVAHHPQSSQVLTVANDLHRQLTRIITTAKHNSNQLGVVTRLLTLEQQVLATNHAPNATLALAASRHISDLLHDTTKPVVALTHPNASPTSQPTTLTPSVPIAKPTAPLPSTPATKHKHHKHPSKPKHATHTSTPTPTPSNPLFGEGLFDAVR